MSQDTTPPIKHGDQAIKLPVGEPASLTFSNDPKEKETEGIFVGSEPPKYTIFRLPSDFNSASLKKGQPLGVKCAASGNVYTYNASVMDYLEKYKLVFISYPQTVEQVPLRKEDRIGCCIPATANVQKRALKGLVTDISYHGCQFNVKIPPTFKLQRVSVLTDIDLSLSLSGYTDPQALKGKVRNTNFDEFRIALGIEFEKLEDQFVKRLSDFIERLKTLQ
ncbi:putative pilus assembly protein PilZ, type IV [Desulfosarcina variabilis str. Montpellier]|uniref:PilZ domain-containing protein n=1 Tax=Desulfosarcina variabilis TaxID=2300 RepID=UPI003AFAF386